MKFKAGLSFPLLLLALTGCTGPGFIIAAGTTAGIIATKPSDPPPADTEDQIAEHESWCYETLGYTECYTKPQKVDANRLVNVDPANEYPLTPEAYRTAASQTNP